MRWKGLFLAGSIGALAFVIMVIVPLVLVVAAPQPPTTGGEAVLSYIASHRAVYLVELLSFAGPSFPALVVFLALGVALSRADRNLAALGAVTGIASEIVALALGSSPPSLSGGLAYLGDQYARAAGDAARASLAAGAEALIAAANAVSAAGILTAAGILFLSLAMRKGPVHPAVAWIGIVTGALGIVSEALRPLIGPAYIPYGLLLPAWFALVGWRLLSLRDV